MRRDSIDFEGELARHLALANYRLPKDSQTLPLDLGHELIVDNFAGGGGTSTGLEAAFGRPVDIAINHDPEALAMHAINHPKTLHLCENVWQVHPLKITRGRPVALVWLSPDCRHHSKAKGGKPVDKNIRGLAWVGMRWVALCKPRVLALENVEEFVSWGPLLQDPSGEWYPDPKKKGKTFDSFVRQLRGHGYEVDCREMRACDAGAPTIRKRLFLIARRDGLPIVWPEPTHADPSSKAVAEGRLAPWRSAAECIDFSAPAKSIFGRKKPLAVNTMRRVAKGMWRHVLTSDEPFVVGADQAPGQAPEADGALVSAFVGDQSRPAEHRTAAVTQPLRTQCAQVKGGHFNLTAAAFAPLGTSRRARAATLAPLRGTSPAHMGGHSLAQPLSTISAGGTHHGLVGADLLARREPADVQGGAGSKRRNKAALRAPFMTKFRNNSVGHDLREPMHTVTANSFKKRPGGSVPMGLVAACLEQANGGFYEGDGRPVDAPLSTITSKGAAQRLITAYAVKYYSSGGQWQGLAEPMHTLPTKGRMGLVQTVHVPIEAIEPEVLARARLCAAFLAEHLPEHFPQKADLILLGDYVLVDITLRMLKPRELFRAQGFPESYIIDEIPDPRILFEGGVQAAEPLSVPRIPLTATAQVRMCGNSVSPLQAEFLMRANFAHERAIYGRLAA